MMLALFHVSGNPASSVSSTLRPTLSKPLGNTFEIALYTVTDPEMKTYKNEDNMSIPFFQILGDEHLKSSVMTSGLGYEKLLACARRRKLPMTLSGLTRFETKTGG